MENSALVADKGTETERKKIQKLAGKLVFFQKHDKEMFICTENEHRRKRSMEGSSGMRQREEELWVDWVEGRIMDRKNTGISTGQTTVGDFCRK